MTEFGKRLAIVVGVILVGAVVLAGYNLIYRPLVAIEGRFWDVIIDGGGAVLGVIVLGATYWAVQSMIASAHRKRRRQGHPVIVKEGQVLAGWELQDGSIQYPPQALPGASITHLTTSTSTHAGHQGYPPRWLVEPTGVEEQKAEEPRLLPERAPTTWEEERRKFAPGQFFLGWLVDRPLWATFDQLLVAVLVGMQGFGKTTLARLIALQHLLWGGGMIIYDPWNDIAAEMAEQVDECWSDAKDVEASAACVLEEIADRMVRYRRGERNFRPILIALDEGTQYPADQCPSLVELLRQGNDVCRKAKIRFVISGTRAPAAALGGRMAKQNSANVFVFNSMNRDLLADFGITGRLAEALHSALFKAGKGFCALRSGTLALEGTGLMLHNLEPAAFTAELREARAHPSRYMHRDAWTPFPSDQPELWQLAKRRAAGRAPGPATSAAAFTPTTTATTPGVEQPARPIPLFGHSSHSKQVKNIDPAVLDEIKRLRIEEGLGLNAICRRMTGASGGAMFYVIRDVLTEAGLLGSRVEADETDGDEEVQEAEE